MKYVKYFLVTFFLHWILWIFFKIAQMHITLKKSLYVFTFLENWDIVFYNFFFIWSL